MAGWKWVRRRLEVLFNKESADRELEEEIRHHLNMETRDLTRGGMSPDEARRQAAVDFGGAERVKEQIRDVRGARMLDDLLQDFRLALRSLPKRPAFLLAVLLTLGIGIGGNVAMFTILDGSLFGALPFPESHRLVMPRTTFEGRVNFTSSGPDYFDYREQLESFEALGASLPFPETGTVTGSGEPERIAITYAHGDVFRALGVAPAMGLLFSADESEREGPPVLIISHGYWQRRFGGSPDILGRSLTLNGTPHTVVGVMPAGFFYVIDVDAWRPMQRNGYMAGGRQFHNWTLVGRLASGVTLETAQTEVDVVAAQLREAYPVTNRSKGLHLKPLQDALAERYRPTLIMLMAAVVLLLVIACGNVAGLLLARGSTRGREMAVRSVMGAGRGRLARQLLTESSLLALGAGLIGVVAAVWLERGILAFVSLDLLGVEASGVSAGAVGFATILSLSTLILFGVVPALRASSAEPAAELRGGVRLPGTLGRTRFRSGLVIAQVTLTVVLLVVSGLLLRSFIQLRNVDPGFDASRMLTASISLPSDQYGQRDARVAFFTEFQERVQGIPGVEAVALIDRIPIRNPGGNYEVATPEVFMADPEGRTLAYRRLVLPGYFDAMGIPLLVGRDVTDTDDDNSALVLVISEGMAEALFPGEDPLGRTLALDGGREEPIVVDVIGVVGDVTTSRLAGDGWYAMYTSYRQWGAATMGAAIRTRGAPGSVTPAVRDVLRQLDGDVPLADIRTMDDVLSQSVSDRKAIAAVLGMFAVVALLLAALGLYGVLAYHVATRTHEIGVRIALGATVGGVTQVVLRRGLRLVAAGLLLGLPAALLSARLVQGMLFGVGTADPVTFAGVSVFLGGIAVVACLVPAMRAARTDPVEAFRAN